MDVYKTSLRYKRGLAIAVFVEFIREKEKPFLEIGDDMQSYTDGKKIHIGTKMFEDQTDDPKTLFKMLYFVVSHEMQHIHSTVDKDWEAAMQLCEREIDNELARRILKHPVRLVKETDFEKFYEDLYAHGVLINRHAIQSLIHFVINSLEDGRIENIRSVNHPFFRGYRQFYRGLIWKKDMIPDDAPTYDKMDDRQKLETILANILMLSTVEIYQKGFYRKYGTSPMMKELTKLIPHIRTAIFAKTCRECMDEGVKIVMMLLDKIIEASKATELEKSMLELISKILEDLEKSKFNPSPVNEEEGTGESSEAPFGVSVVRSKSNKGDKDSDEDTGEGSGSVTEKNEEEDSDEESESSKGSSSKKSKESKDKDGHGGSSNGGNGSDPDDYAKGDDGDDTESSKGDSDREVERPFSIKPSGTSDHTDTAPEDPDFDIDAKVEEMMKEAAENADPNMDAAEEEAKREEKFKDTMSKWSPVEKDSLDTSSIDSKYDDSVEFKENEREYVPDAMLPFSLENKGRSLKRKIDDILKNQKSPDQRGLRTGSMDGSLVHRLVYSDVSVFKKRGEETQRNMAGYLLLDNSGSMGYGEGSTRHYACDAVSVLEEGFKDYIPLKIAAFDAGGIGYVYHECIKEFDEVSPANFTHNFLVKGRSGMGNKDGYSIRVAAKELLSRPEKDKLLIVTSDGIPTDYAGGYDEGVKDVRSAVVEARSNGIKVIGLFMYSDQCEDEFEMFRKMYEPSYIICERSEIEDELVRVVKNEFLTSRK